MYPRKETATMSYQSPAFAASAARLVELHREGAARRLAAEAGQASPRFARLAALARRRRRSRRSMAGALVLSTSRYAPHH
jgi:hypothetical protein